MDKNKDFELELKKPNILIKGLEYSQLHGTFVNIIKRFSYFCFVFIKILIFCIHFRTQRTG